MTVAAATQTFAGTAFGLKTDGLTKKEKKDWNKPKMKHGLVIVAHVEPTSHSLLSHCSALLSSSSRKFNEGGRMLISKPRFFFPIPITPKWGGNKSWPILSNLHTCSNNPKGRRRSPK
jgi:hypothetical protein